MSVIIFQTQSILIVSLMLFGIFQLKKRKKNVYKHIKMMKLAMLWDLLLIAQIELTRGAIFKASKATSNSALLNIHISLAIATVLLYFVVYRFGKRLYAGQKSYFRRHKALGVLTLVMRIATLITSFYIL